MLQTAVLLSGERKGRGSNADLGEAMAGSGAVDLERRPHDSPTTDRAGIATASPSNFSAISTPLRGIALGQDVGTRALSSNQFA